MNFKHFCTDFTNFLNSIACTCLTLKRWSRLAGRQGPLGDGRMGRGCSFCRLWLDWCLGLDPGQQRAAAPGGAAGAWRPGARKCRTLQATPALSGTSVLAVRPGARPEVDSTGSGLRRVRAHPLPGPRSCQSASRPIHLACLLGQQLENREFQQQFADQRQELCGLTDLETVSVLNKSVCDSPSSPPR